MNEIPTATPMFFGTGFPLDQREHYVTKPEVDKINMAASKLEMHVSPLPDEISTKCQRLNLCFRRPATDWNSREIYATKPEVVETNMTASKLEMHVSQLPDEISTTFQRLYICFRGPAIDWGPREYYATKPEVDKPIWRP